MFKELRYELLRGLAYRHIRHEHMGKYTTWLPLVVAVMVVGVYALLPVKPVMLGKDGAVSSALSILSTLPGFYFAGLAAVATFGGTLLDTEMPDPAPRINILTRGKLVERKLTRRQFLSYLFSYLVLLSFLLCGGLLLLNAAEGSITLLSSAISGVDAEWVWQILVYATFFLFSMMFGSLVISTLQGVFFLTENIHQPN